MNVLTILRQKKKSWLVSICCIFTIQSCFESSLLPYPVTQIPCEYGLGIVVFGTGAPGQPKVGAVGWGGHRVRPPDPLQRRRHCCSCGPLLPPLPRWPPAAPLVQQVRLRWRPATNSTRSLCWKCRGHTPSTERRPATTWAPSGIRTYPNHRPTQRLIITPYLYLQFIIYVWARNHNFFRWHWNLINIIKHDWKKKLFCITIHAILV